MKQKHAIWLAVTALTVCTYLGLWMYSVQWFQREIDNVYAHAEKDGMRFLGPKPALSNFPFVPEVYYTGGVQTGNAIILFPEMKVRGYPVPGTSLDVSFPAGISLDGIADPAIWTLDGLLARVVIPWSLPASFEYGDLEQWKNRGGAITVKHFSIVKEQLVAEGEGALSLDDALQPVFTMTSKIENHEAFIHSQVDKGLIEPFPGAIGITMLNGLAKTNEKTGEKEVVLAVNVKDRMLSVGPLQVLPLPEIQWDRRTSLAQPQ